MKITLLGTGTSQGVPVIGCDCEVCRSENVFDQRLRSSILVESEGTTLVIDTGPDFRTQMLRCGNQNLNGVLYTHAHKDHTAGLDDIRPYFFKSKKPVDLYGLPVTLNQIKEEFGYMFHENKYPGVPDVNLHHLNAEEEFQIGNLKIQPLKLQHAKADVLGYRFGEFAYITDANFIPQKTFEKLAGIRFLVINALRKTAHPSHFTLEEALAICDKLDVEKAWFTHISHGMGLHTIVNAALPESRKLAYDGLEINY